MLNDQFPKRKTVISKRNVGIIATISTLAQLYDVKFFKMWLPEYTDYSVSGSDGRGRKDVVEICKNLFGKRLNFESQNEINKVRGK